MAIALACLFFVAYVVDAHADIARFFYDETREAKHILRNQGDGNFPYSIKEMKTILGAEKMNCLEREFIIEEGKEVDHVIIDSDNEIDISYKVPTVEEMDDEVREEEIKKIDKKAKYLAKKELEKEGYIFLFVNDSDLE